MAGKLQVSFIKFFNMKKFLLNIFLLLVILWVIATLGDFAITKGLHKRMDYQQEVWNDLMNPEMNPKLIVLGNCVAQHDINPAIVDSLLETDSYVFPMSNLTFPYHLFIWDMYKKYHDTLPQMVILCLDYSDMVCRDAKTNQENEQFLSLMYDKDARHFLTEYGGYSMLDAYVPCFRYFGHPKRIKYGLMNFAGVKKYSGRRDRYKGYQALDKPYVSHRDWYPNNFVQPVEDRVVDMLDSFLADCKQLGIDVVITLPPIAHVLTDLIDNKDEVYSLYESMANKYGYAYTNYCAPYWVSMDTNNFETSNHLNYKMADVYTAELMHFILDSVVFNKKIAL